MSADKQILYAAIARDHQDILCNYEKSGEQSNFPRIVLILLKKIKKNTKMSCALDQQYFFHYVDEDNYTYLCMTDAVYSKRLAFSFLEDIQSRFIEDISFEQRQQSFAHSLNNLFGPTLNQQITQYNSEDGDKLNALKNKVTQVNTLMVENIDKLLEREEKVELLVTKTQAMSKQSTTLKKMAVQVKRKAYWKNMRIKIIIALILIIIIFICVTFGCGGFDYHNCK